MAKSLMLSTQLITDDGRPRMSKEQLQRVQVQMRNGVPAVFDANELAQLVAEKEAWDRTPRMSWLRVVVLALTILSIPAALFALGWWIGHMRWQ